MKELVPIERIAQKIYLIRGHKVMLDSDLAELYDVKTQALNQAVKRNKERFPVDFMFSLSRSEILNISQFVISSKKIKHSPNINVFTEQGVAMLSSVLRSKRAVLINIMIMRAFVKIRELLATHKKIEEKIEKFDRKFIEYDKHLITIYELIKQLTDKPKEQLKQKQIGFRMDI